MVRHHPVAVIGAGNMGSGIAQKLAFEGCEVLLYDADPAQTSAGMERIRALFHEVEDRGLFSRHETARMLSRVRPASALEDLAPCDFAIEAVYEDEAVKLDLFARLGRVLAPDAVVATNTSSLSVSRLAEAYPDPAQFAGLHFFYHPAKNRLVEVVAGTKTSHAALEQCFSLARRMGKVALVSRDRPGFIVNRYFVPWLNEAVRLVEEGAADIATVEAAARGAFGAGMGPFELMNATGVPIAWRAQATLGRELGSFYTPAKLLAEAGEANRPWDLSGTPDPGRFGEIADRLWGAVFQAAGELMDEAVCRAEDADRGARIGLRWKSGPFERMNALGVGKVLELARRVGQRYGVAPSPSLVRKAEEATPWHLARVDFTVEGGAEGGVARIIVNRPEAMNALNETVVEEFAAAFREALSREDVKGVVIEGVGKAFVAGADVRFFTDRMREGDLARITAFTRRCHEVLNAVEASPKPVVAAVDGLCLGGGVELALACHAVVASERAHFALPETSIGIYPCLGGISRLARVVGKPMAKRLVLAGLPLDGKTAHEIGLAGYLTHSGDGALKLARELAGGACGKLPGKYAPKEVPVTWRAAVEAFSDERIVEILNPSAPVAEGAAADARRWIKRNAPLAVALANRIFDEGEKLSLSEALELEIANLETIFATRDALEGLSSIGRKRPEYIGE